MTHKKTTLGSIAIPRRCKGCGATTNRRRCPFCNRRGGVSYRVRKVDRRRSPGDRRRNRRDAIGVEGTREGRRRRQAAGVGFWTGCSVAGVDRVVGIGP